MVLQLWKWLLEDNEFAVRDTFEIVITPVNDAPEINLPDNVVFSYYSFSL